MSTTYAGGFYEGFHDETRDELLRLTLTRDVQNHYLIVGYRDPANIQDYTLRVEYHWLTNDTSNPVEATSTQTETVYDDGRRMVVARAFSDGPDRHPVVVATSQYDAAGHLTFQSSLDALGQGTSTNYDPATGVVDDQSTTALLPGGGGTYVVTALDNDVANVQPWHSAVLHYTVRNGDVEQSGAEYRMDDGTLTVERTRYETAADGSVLRLGSSTTHTDLQGRVDHYEDTVELGVGSNPAEGFYSRVLDYDVGTGHLIFSHLDYGYFVVEQTFDRETGRLDFVDRFVPREFNSGGYDLESTDYDLRNEYAWTTHTTTYQNVGFPNYHTSAGTEFFTMDDGTFKQVQHIYYDGLIVTTNESGLRTTLTDAQGRVTRFVEHQDYIYRGKGQSSEGVLVDRALDYDPATGQLTHAELAFVNGTHSTIDYGADGQPSASVTTYADRHTVSTYTDGSTVTRNFDAQGRLDVLTIQDAAGNRQMIDYDAASGHMDLSVSNLASGRVETRDYDAATGGITYFRLVDPDGHTLAQSFDAAGRLDYNTEHLTDGRTVATDYDLADQYPWTTYTIVYDALGQVQSAVAA